MIGVGADVGAMGLQSLDEFGESADLGRLGHGAPVIEASGHVGRVGVGQPQALQLLLEAIERRQWLVVRQQLIQPAPGRFA